MQTNDDSDAEGGALTDVQDIAVTVTDVDEAVADTTVANTATTADTTLVADTTPPTVQILGAPSSFADTTSFNVTVEFSETVIGFTLGDITVGNAAAYNFVAVNGNTYTADITPTGAGDVTIDVAANVVTDEAGNGNTVPCR